MSIIIFIISNIWQIFHYSNDLYVWTLVPVLYFHWGRVKDLNQSCMQNASTALGGTSHFLGDFSVHNTRRRAEEHFHWVAWLPTICIVCITYIAQYLIIRTCLTFVTTPTIRYIDSILYRLSNIILLLTAIIIKNDCYKNILQLCSGI